MTVTLDAGSDSETYLDFYEYSLIRDHDGHLITRNVIQAASPDKMGIEGLKVWLDAIEPKRDGNPYVNDEQLSNLWFDKLEFNNAADFNGSLEYPGSSPTFKTNIFGELPALHFEADGTYSDYFLIAKGNQLTDTEELTIITYLKPETDSWTLVSQENLEQLFVGL